MAAQLPSVRRAFYTLGETGLLGTWATAMPCASSFPGVWRALYLTMSSSRSVSMAEGHAHFLVSLIKNWFCACFIVVHAGNAALFMLP